MLVSTIVLLKLMMMCVKNSCLYTNNALCTDDVILNAHGRSNGFIPCMYMYAHVLFLLN